MEPILQRSIPDLFLLRSFRAFVNSPNPAVHTEWVSKMSVGAGEIVSSL